MGKKKKKEKYDFVEVRQAYLMAAISDVSSYIHLMDTKVSIIMAAQGVIIAGGVSIYDDLIKSMKYYNSILEKTVLVTSVSGFAVFMILVYGFGLKTILARSVTLNRTTSWFINEERLRKGFDEYLDDLNEKSEDELLNDIAAELFKLNEINSRKMKSANMTIKMFVGSLFFLMGYIIQFILIQI